MKIRHRKLIAYIISHATLTVFYFKEPVEDVRKLLIRFIVFNAMIFVGGAVANTFIKSKWFQPELNEVNK